MLALAKQQILSSGASNTASRSKPVWEVATWRLAGWLDKATPRRRRRSSGGIGGGKESAVAVSDADFHRRRSSSTFCEDDGTHRYPEQSCNKDDMFLEDV